jgi:hypothetical protein
MICIIAGNEREAKQWAYAQMLDRSEWFYPYDSEDLIKRENFHVIVIGTAGENITPAQFERVLHLAKSRGKVNRR